MPSANPGVRQRDRHKTRRFGEPQRCNVSVLPAPGKIAGPAFSDHRPEKMSGT
jgi:hypothetical protein